jgi:hypothetical protein
LNINVIPFCSGHNLSTALTLFVFLGSSIVEGISMFILITEVLQETNVERISTVADCDSDFEI